MIGQERDLLWPYCLNCWVWPRVPAFEIQFSSHPKTLEPEGKCDIHYYDVIMTTIASQITSLTVVYSIVYSDADQRKHQSSASLAFVWGIHRGRWIPRTNGQIRGKCFHLMTSSWTILFSQSIWKVHVYLLSRDTYDISHELHKTSTAF